MFICAWDLEHWHLLGMKGKISKINSLMNCWCKMCFLVDSKGCRHKCNAFSFSLQNCCTPTRVVVLFKFLLLHVLGKEQDFNSTLRFSFVYIIALSVSLSFLRLCPFCPFVVTVRIDTLQHVYSSCVVVLTTFCWTWIFWFRCFQLLLHCWVRQCFC